MNSLKIPRSNNDARYDRVVNNIIYESFPQDNCILCNSPICICNNRKVYKNHKSKIIYHSFNTDVERRYQSLKSNRNTINLNKIKIKPIQIPLLHDKNKQTLFIPSPTTRDLQKKNLKNNYIFYNDNDTETIYNNPVEKFRINNYSNKHQNDAYNNDISLINCKKLNNSVSGNLVIPYFNNNKNMNSIYDSNNILNSYYFNGNMLTINKNNYIINHNNISLEKEKRNKYRKIFNIKEEKDMNKTLEKDNYGSYSNIHKKSLNYINTINYDLNSISQIYKNKSSNKRYKYIKKANNSQINHHPEYFNHINSNLNNNYYNYHITDNNNNKINIPQYSIEKIKKYKSSNINENKEKKELKPVIISRRKNIALNKNKREDIYEKYKKEKRKSNYEIKESTSQIYQNNIKNSKNCFNIYKNNIKIELNDENKENKSYNIIIENSLIKDKNSNGEINIKLLEGVKNDYIKNKKNSFSPKTPNNKMIYDNKKNYFVNVCRDRQNNIIEDIDQNKNNEINDDYKLKSIELMSLLKAANDEIIQLKSKLKDFKNLNARKNVIKNYKKLNGVQMIGNNSKRCIKTKYLKKNFLKIKIGQNNINKKINNSFSSKPLIKKGNPANSQNLEIRPNFANLDASNDAIFINNNYNKNSGENSKSQPKYIFKIYNNKNKNCKNSILCFNAENKSFEIKTINYSNDFHKNYFDSINKSNKINKSLYLINDNNYYIVTGLNCNKFYKYSYKGNKISQLNDLNYNHINGALTSYSDKIICLGGELSKKVEIFSKNENIWSELPEMQIERSYFATCIIKNRYLFTFFGYNFPNKKYLNSIEYLDLSNYRNIQNHNFYWRYLDYNYFCKNLSLQKINLIGSVAINYKDEKIIFLGGKNCTINDNNEGYYQLILDDSYINSDEIIGYIEKITTKSTINFYNNYFFNNYKYFDEIIHNNILKEPSFVSFDNNYNVHMLKLSTMNHETYSINQ